MIAAAAMSFSSVSVLANSLRLRSAATRGHAGHLADRRHRLSALALIAARARLLLRAGKRQRRVPSPGPDGARESAFRPSPAADTRRMIAPMPARRPTASAAGHDDSRGRGRRRLFERVQVGRLRRRPRPDGADRTLAANPHLKLILGYAGRRPRTRRSGRSRPAASSIRWRAPTSSSGCSHDGSVTDFLVRVRRVDCTPIWVEITAQAEPSRRAAPCRSRRWSATSATARSSTTRRATSTTSCCRPRSWPRSARRSRASRTS